MTSNLIRTPPMLRRAVTSPWFLILSLCVLLVIVIGLVVGGRITYLPSTRPADLTIEWRRLVQGDPDAVLTITATACQYHIVLQGNEDERPCTITAQELDALYATVRANAFDTIGFTTWQGDCYHEPVSGGTTNIPQIYTDLRVTVNGTTYMNREFLFHCDKYYVGRDRYYRVEQAVIAFIPRQSR